MCALSLEGKAFDLDLPPSAVSSMIYLPKSTTIRDQRRRLKSPWLCVGKAPESKNTVHFERRFAPDFLFPELVPENEDLIVGLCFSNCL